ncbi:hypothetical protein DBR43_09505 [Pedobacter sp. KBW06]|uniref:hypothetical protein n=1 Tax=Pedobacter sp. KBW06 TaxID=2153359 RepID=UPI000F59C0DD|nr:hypothetical protein [Pedobacter sp. KBW06]RQO75564.1 hypothetical protein DBR43_09505 [Pedobacter sp. KBW06]
MLDDDSHVNRVQQRADRDRLESPLEEIFIENLEKYLSPSISILPQYEIETIAGKFRLDFVIAFGETKIGLECDGKDFHDAFRDEWRDGLILDTGEIETIYRFRGKDIFYALEDCIYIIYKYDYRIFNNRYPHFCARLISQEIEEYFTIEESRFKKRESVMINYDIRNDDNVLTGQFSFFTLRRNRNVEGRWQIFVKYVKTNPGLSLDQLIAQYKSGKR